MIAPAGLRDRLEGGPDRPVVIFVGLSRDFAAGHVPGAHWLPRGWLELRIESVAPSLDASLVVTSLGDEDAVLSAASLADLGYGEVSALEGGTAAWRTAGYAVEQGLSGVMSPPVDMVPRRDRPHVRGHGPLPALGRGVGRKVPATGVTGRR